MAAPSKASAAFPRWSRTRSSRNGGELLLSRRLIRENGHPGQNHVGVDEFEVHSPRAVLEQAPPRPEQDRGKQDAVLVDEVVFQQAVREVLTAATSPSIRREFSHCRSLSVVDATYLGMLLILST
jgi:hypothetical protein